MSTASSNMRPAPITRSRYFWRTCYKACATGVLNGSGFVGQDRLPAPFRDAVQLERVRVVKVRLDAGEVVAQVTAGALHRSQNKRSQGLHNRAP